MSGTKTVIKIVREYLTSNGYGGLRDDEGCGCEVADLAPCGQIGEECTAGYRHVDPTDGEHWVISLTQEPLTDEQWQRIRGDL